MHSATTGAMAQLCHRPRFLILAAVVAVAWAAIAHAETGGELQVRDASGRTTGRFPLRHTDVQAAISGGTASVTVEQTFQNPYDRGIEAVYVFPLPVTSAIDDLEIRIGERVVRGAIQTREAARTTYETAKSQGRVAALLDQERPNIFTQQVANIQPGHEIRVRIHYTENLKYADGHYEMVIPTVVGPRYIPGQAAGGGVVPARHDANTVVHADTDQVPDASRITPPVLPPGERSGHDIMITVNLDAGVPIQDLNVLHHAVDIERRGRNAARVRLRPADTIPNKDFVLRYGVAGTGPEFGMLAHREPGQHEGLGFFTLQLQPEANVRPEEARPKELVFVLDTSGSMNGEPIAKSRAAVRWALQNLGPNDTFQLIRFANAASALAPQPLANTPENIALATSALDQLEGGGGTEMLTGIRAALEFPHDPARLRIVAFLTDGYIGNETQIFAAVRQSRGDARIFAFGIGNSVNRYLLDGLAAEGRGVVDYVGLDEETRPVVERFYDRIGKPYLTDLTVDWGRLPVQDMTPANAPDLFAGQPLVFSGRYRAGAAGDITIRGRLGSRPFTRRVYVTLPALQREHPEIATLWARRRIDELTSKLVRAEDPEVTRQITATALEYRLLSQYTSFVAVDNQVIAADGKPVLVPQPVDMPEGVRYEGVFGPAPVDSRFGMVGLNTGVVVQGGQLHVRGGRSAELNLPPSATPAPFGYGTMSEVVKVCGKMKSIDVKSSDVSHVSTDREILSLPMESVLEAVAANAGVAMPGVLRVRVLDGVRCVQAGKVLRIEVEVTNTGTSAVTLPRTVDVTAAAGAVLLRAADGAAVVLPAPLPALEPATDGVVVAPGQTRRITLELRTAALTSAPAPGRYRLECAAIAGAALLEPLRCEFDLR